MGKFKLNRLPSALAWPVYSAIRGLTTLAGAGDLAGTLGVARRAGRAWGSARFTRGRRRRAEENLAVAFPGMSAAERTEVAIRSYEHLFMLGVEMIYTPRLLSHEGWAGRVELHGLEGALRRLVSGPTIFICGHSGNWEVAGYSLSLLGFPVHALYRPLDLRALDEYVRGVRGRRGLVLIDKFGAARELPRVMERGMPLGFVADQNAGQRGLYVPFFGRMTSTYKAIGLTAVRYKASIIVGSALRLGGEEVGGSGGLRREPRGLHYRMSALDLFGPEEYMAQPDPLFYIAARYRRAIERGVRAAPEQYLWMHRYWKSRPRWEQQGRGLPRSVEAKLASLPWMTEGEMASLKSWAERDAAACAAEGVRAGMTGPGDAQAAGGRGGGEDGGDGDEPL